MSTDQETETHVTLAERIQNGPLHALAAMHLSLVELSEPDVISLAPWLVERIEEVRGQAEWIIDDLNRIVRSLATASIIDLREKAGASLHERLRQLCAAFEAEGGIACRFAIEPEHATLGALPGEVLYRSVRELLTNVVKHAHATKVDVTSELNADGARVFSVKDDGIGLITPQRLNSDLAKSRFGLWNVDLCLSEIGGHMEIESDSGVSVRIVLPIHLAGE